MNKYIIIFFSKQKAKESGTQVQIPPAQPVQQQKWEPLGEPVALKPAPTSSPSDDLLQLNSAFSVPLQQSSSTAFSQSPAFPPSQAFPAAQGFGQGPVPNGFSAAPQAGAWGGPTATSGKLQAVHTKM